MRMSLLRRLMFVAILWGAVAFGSTVSLEATFCEECAPVWSACNDNCWHLYSNNQQELQACLDDCEEEYWLCTFTCTAGQCVAIYCDFNDDCVNACGFYTGVCDTDAHRCCCPVP